MHCDVTHHLDILRPVRLDVSDQQKSLIIDIEEIGYLNNVWCS